MHPPLVPHKHEHCREEIKALVACHERSPLAKFWGACNQQKWDLDACFRREKALKSRANRERAERSRERLRARAQDGSSSSPVSTGSSSSSSSSSESQQ